MSVAVAGGVGTLLVDARPIDHPTARQRGIGRYVTGLLHGLVAVDAPVVALVGSDVEADVLGAAVADLTIRRWSPGVVREHAAPGTWFVATQLMLHPVSLDPIPRVITEARLPVAAVMYDVIPYRFPDIYLIDPNARRQAALRAPLARTTDLLLAISEFAASTASDELAYPRDRVAMIGAGVEPRFAPADGDPRPGAARVLGGHVGAYVVAVTGGDDRKNTEGLIRAWGLTASEVSDHHLVIATAHDAALLRRWQTCAERAGVDGRVVFTGALDDEELVAVIQGASLAVMPSFEEGFGLPVLEAAACGVPAICSDRSSLPEVLDEPAACFDPGNDRSIAEAVVRALTDTAHRQVLATAAQRATDRWTWPNVARSTLAAIDSTGPRWSAPIVRPARRVAVAGVFTGSDTGRHNEAVAKALGEHTDVLVFADGSTTPEPTRADGQRWPVRALGRYVKPWDLDHVVAVLDDPSDNAATSELARAVPCHLWIHEHAVVGAVFGANLRALEIAHSIIVTNPDLVDRLRRAAGRSVPVLVLDDPSDVAGVAAAIDEWLDEVVTLDPGTIRRR